MSLRRKQMWIGVSQNEIHGLLTGKFKMDLPEDAEIVHVRSGGHMDLVEFLVRSETYPELEMGMRIPTETRNLISTT